MWLYLLVTLSLHLAGKHWGKKLTTPGCELTASKSLSNVILHFRYTGAVDLRGIHELTLVGAACQLTEEVHQVEETGGTPTHTGSQRQKRVFFFLKRHRLLHNVHIKVKIQKCNTAANKVIKKCGETNTNL